MERVLSLPSKSLLVGHCMYVKHVLNPMLWLVHEMDTNLKDYNVLSFLRSRRNICRYCIDKIINLFHDNLLYTKHLCPSRQSSLYETRLSLMTNFSIRSVCPSRPTFLYEAFVSHDKFFYTKYTFLYKNSFENSFLYKQFSPESKFLFELLSQRNFPKHKLDSNKWFDIKPIG